jgi:hypothetical protein
MSINAPSILVVPVATYLVCVGCLNWNHLRPHFHTADHDCQHFSILIHCGNWIGQQSHFLQN